MIKLYNPPTNEVVTAAEVRAFLRMSSTAYDSTLTSLAISARQLAEAYTRRSFITQTWQRMLDYSEITDAIKLPRPPVQTISSIKVYNDVGVESTVDAAWYMLDNFSEPGWATLTFGHAWPYRRLYNGMIIEYVCGYGDDYTDVPQPIRMAIAEAAAYAFVNGKMGDLPDDSISKLTPYRVYI